MHPSAWREGYHHQFLFHQSWLFVSFSFYPCHLSSSHSLLRLHLLPHHCHCCPYVLTFDTLPTGRAENYQIVINFKSLSVLPDPNHSIVTFTVRTLEPWTLWLYFHFICTLFSLIVQLFLHFYRPNLTNHVRELKQWHWLFFTFSPCFYQCTQRLRFLVTSWLTAYLLISCTQAIYCRHREKTRVLPKYKYVEFHLFLVFEWKR